ncbi:hypothetical protein [Vreelandella venusta]|uniref:hypothetical protein n=1 Tax=Vreelandella venusta TaxID=44935 RepID=UPI003C2C2840
MSELKSSNLDFVLEEARSLSDRSIVDVLQGLLNILALGDVNKFENFLSCLVRDGKLRDFLIFRPDLFFLLNGDIVLVFYLMYRVFGEGSIGIASKLISMMNPVSDTERLRVLSSFVSARVKEDDFIRCYGFVDILKKNQSHINRKMEMFDVSLCPKFSGKNKKIPVGSVAKKVLVCIAMLNPRLKSTHLYFMTLRVKALRAAGFDVFFCFTGEHTLRGKFYNYNQFSDKFCAFHDKYWRTLLGRQPYYINESNSSSIIDSYLHYLRECDPDVVLFAGDVWPRGSDFCQSITYQSYPVGYLPFQASMKPKKNLDGIITSIPQYKNEIENAHSFEGECHLVVTPFEPFGDERNYDGDLALDSDAFVVVTPLTQNRLVNIFKNLKDTMVDTILKIFDENKELVWLLIGVDHEGFDGILETIPALKKYAESGRFLAMQETDRLRGLFRVVDTFFAVPGMAGGGGGASMAIYEGLPVVTSRLSDCSARTSEKLIYNNEDELYFIFKKLISDKDFYDNVTAECSDSMARLTLNTSGKEMKRAITKIHEAGVGRLCVN